MVSGESFHQIPKLHLQIPKSEKEVRVVMVFNKNFCSGFPVLGRTSWSLEDVCTTSRIFQYKVPSTKSTSPSLIGFPFRKRLGKNLSYCIQSRWHQFQPAPENTNNSFVKRVYDLYLSHSEILLTKEIEWQRKVISCPW